MADQETPPGDSPSSLGAALLAFQSEALHITKDQTARIQTSKGPGFEYSYLSLEKLLEEVLPKLNALGLVWLSMPTTLPDGSPGLYYELAFPATQEKISDTMSLMLRAGTPQDQGAAISYARRYALLAVLNLAPDKDEDGAVTTAQAGAQQQTGVKRVTKAAATKMVERAERAGEFDKFRLCLSHYHGEDVGTFEDKDGAVKAAQKLYVNQAAGVNGWLDRVEKAALQTGGEAPDAA